MAGILIVSINLLGGIVIGVPAAGDAVPPRRSSTSRC